MIQSLTGKVALITGGSRGIGLAVAHALSREGVHIGIIGRDESRLKEAVASLTASGVRLAYAGADVADAAAIQDAVQQLNRELGPADILVNNAGMAAFGSFMDMPADRWEEIIRVNLMGAYHTTRAVLPAMIERNAGDIINIASTAGFRGAAQTSAYSASKFALIGMSESLMMEVRKHNIRVSTFAPSTVATDMAVKDLGITDGNPDKVLQPEDLADLLVMQLKLPQRAMVKLSSLWSTNP